MQIDVVSDSIMALGFLLRQTLDPLQEPTGEDIRLRNAMLNKFSLDEIEVAAKFGGVKVDQAITLGVQVKMDAVKEMDVVDTPDSPHDVDVEFINSALMQASDWNETHFEEEPTLSEWEMLSVEMEVVQQTDDNSDTNLEII
jgi:hypothetical protein